MMRKPALTSKSGRISARVRARKLTKPRYAVSAARQSKKARPKIAPLSKMIRAHSFAETIHGIRGHQQHDRKRKHNGRNRHHQRTTPRNDNCQENAATGAEKQPVAISRPTKSAVEHESGRTGETMDRPGNE